MPIRLASELYACDDAGIERAIWLLLDRLEHVAERQGPVRAAGTPSW